MMLKKSTHLIAGIIAAALGGGGWLYLKSEDAAFDREIAGQTNRVEPGFGTVASSGADRGPASLAIPVRYRFAGVGGVLAAADEADLLARYTPAQRELIGSFFAAYGAGRESGGQYAFSNVFSFHSADQLGWLVSQGFPTPDDVLAAAMMSDEALKALSDEGNFKASAFYLGRQSAQAPKAGEAVDRAALADEIENLKLAGDLLSEGSALGPYAYARYALASGQRGMALASLGYAKQLGDMRDDFALAFAEANPDIPPLEVLRGYQLVQSTSMKNPRLRDLSALARRPRFEVFPNE